MSRTQKSILRMAANRKTSDSDWGGRVNGHHDSAGLLSWYMARPQTPGLAYALTINGYVLLS